MSNVSITSPFSGGVTIIPNQFIEHYMIHANGEFVKIYLYLMYVSEGDKDFSLEQIADTLSCTESDVLRALKYWEKEGLLSLLPVNSRKPDSVSFIMPMVPAAKSVTATQAAVPEQTCKPLTPDRVKQLKENAEIAELLFIAEKYIGKPLSPTETSRILYFYEGLGFSTDLIEYLIEYCVSKGHRSMNYIEKVAFGWKNDDITDVESAKKSCESYHKDYYTILKALGIRGRSPIDAEVAMMKTWIQEYGFTLDIIIEACTRTVLKTQPPSWDYANKILTDWNEANVHTISDIRKLDLAHEQSKSEKPAQRTKKPANSFSGFEQRAYDYESLESQLLNR